MHGALSAVEAQHATRSEPAAVEVDGSQEAEAEGSRSESELAHAVSRNAEPCELEGCVGHGKCKKSLAPTDSARAQTKESHTEHQHQKRPGKAHDPLKRAEIREIGSIWFRHDDGAGSKENGVGDAPERDESVAE